MISFIISHLEPILWIVAFFIVWETVYIIRLKFDDLWNDDWVMLKITSFLGTAITFTFQIFTLFLPDMEKMHYKNLIWEVGIIVFLIAFFYLNKKIADWMDK